MSGSVNMKFHETIIIGAGPCGLAAAVDLETHGMDYLVLEEFNIVNAIYNYPTQQSFWKLKMTMR